MRHMIHGAALFLAIILIAPLAAALFVTWRISRIVLNIVAGLMIIFAIICGMMWFVMHTMATWDTLMHASAAAMVLITISAATTWLEHRFVGGNRFA